MTATPSTWDPADCPDWCTSGTAEYPCRGEHYFLSTASYMTASANIHAATGHPSDGPRLPVVGVGASWPEPWGSTLSVYIHHSAEDVDQSIDFQLGEALQFYAAFGEVLGRVLASGVRPDLLISRQEFEKLLTDIDAPRLALGIHERAAS